MNNQISLLFIILGLMLSFPVLAGGTTTFTVEDQTFKISTGTGEGKCLVQDNGEFGKDITCTDGADMAIANSLLGCTERYGKGTCIPVAKKKFKGVGHFSVSCPDSKIFIINTSDEGGGECSLDIHDDQIFGAYCQDVDGNSASMICGKDGKIWGCDRTTGAGSCMSI